VRIRAEAPAKQFQVSGLIHIQLNSWIANNFDCYANRQGGVSMTCHTVFAKKGRKGPGWRTKQRIRSSAVAGRRHHTGGRIVQRREYFLYVFTAKQRNIGGDSQECFDPKRFAMTASEIDRH
jgi:hypothetical protein